MQQKDKFFYRAKREGFKSRAVYKLKQLNNKYRLFDRSSSVLDLGCSPGSWVQYEVSKAKYVLGVDITSMSVKGADFLKKSVLDQDIIDSIIEKKKKFDCVLSDMAPKTSGIIHIDQERSLELCERAFYIASGVLKSGGNFVCKLFQGSHEDDFLKELKKAFKVVKTVKPAASKRKSKEMYILCLGFKPVSLDK